MSTHFNIGTLDFKKPPRYSMHHYKKYFREHVFIISNVLSDQPTWKNLTQDVLDFMKRGFERKEIREYPISFKLHPYDDEVLHVMQANHFLTNLVLWYGFMITDTQDMMQECHIQPGDKTRTKDLIQYCDDYIASIPNNDIVEMNAILDEIVTNTKCISQSFTDIQGMGISIKTFMEMEDLFPEVKDIIYTQLDPTMQPKDVEDELIRKTERLIEYFTTYENDLQPLFKAGGIIRSGQFKEIGVAIGYKSDLNGTTIPYQISCNLLRGFSDVGAYFVGAISARKAQILQKDAITKPGSLSKKLANAASSIVLSKTKEPCNSHVPIIYLIKTDKHLEKLNGRKYILNGMLKTLNYKLDKHLIGKYIPFKSPMTCTCSEGICHECYGHLSEVNSRLLIFSIGDVAALKTMMPLGQWLLSSKHFQTTSSETITVSDEFGNFYEMEANTVSFTEEIKSEIETSELYLKLNPTIEEDEGSDIYYVTEATLVTSKGTEVNNLTIKTDDENTKLYFTEELVSLYQKHYPEPIPFESITEEMSIFNIEVKSEELTKPVKSIEAMLMKSGDVRTIHEFAQRFLDTTIETGLDVDAVHNEVIARSLIRSKYDSTAYPDFNLNAYPRDREFQVMTINSALSNNPSPNVRIASGYLKQTLLSPTFYQISAPSHLDALMDIAPAQILAG